MSRAAPPPLAIHGLDWQQALLEVPASATQEQRDTMVASWAQRCWQDLCTALPQQRHAVLAHPGQVQERARVYMATQETSGWLHSPLHLTPQAPRWHADSSGVLLQTARQAAEAGLCGADALVQGTAAVFAALDGFSPEFTGLRRHFPLLGVSPRQQAFAPMPVEMLRPGHAWGLYAVMGDAEGVLRCLDMGARLVQLRLKNVRPALLDAQIARCAAAAHQHGALLFINDHWEAALRHAQQAPGIYGVHLGQEDALALGESQFDQLQASGLRLGVSSQTLSELARALRLRPSCIACGPVHATTTKVKELPPVGEHSLRVWAQLVHEGVEQAGLEALPLVAIGGMDVARAQAAAAAGADSVAVVSSITRADDPVQAIAALQRAVAAGRAGRG